MEIYVQLFIKIAVLCLLGFSLWTARKTCSDIMSNIDKFGDDSKSKNKVATRALFNFWVGFAAVIIIISGIFELIGAYARGCPVISYFMLIRPIRDASGFTSMF